MTDCQLVLSGTVPAACARFLFRPMAWLLALVCFDLGAAGGGKRVFDISADLADKSLRQFALQAGTEVLFSPKSTADVHTNAVKGEYPPRDAIEQMLAGTVLVATHDEKTDSFTIALRAQPGERKPQAPSEAGKKKRDDSDENLSHAMNIKTVNTKTRRTFLGGMFALLTASDPLLAQSTNTNPSAARSEDETATVMSPFLVTSDKDTGYRATSTLAGTRLNTPIKDLAASISIYTKDFLEDIGAVNSNELLIYATGMEASGPGGNYSGFGNDINATQPTNDATRVNPQGTGSRTRGLSSPTFTRNYFKTSIAFDSYNTSMVTVNRGPNAALFGTGSAAGVVDTALITADLNRDSNQFIFRYGNNGAARASLDLNRVLIPKVLAARIALLNDTEEYNQRPAFEDKRRIYGTLSFQPTKTTLLRGNFETGNTYANRPITMPRINNISDYWYAAGRQGYDWTYYDDPARNPNAATQIAGPNTYGSLVGSYELVGLLFTYPEPNAQAPSNAFYYITPTTTTYARNAVATQIFNPDVNRDLATDNIRFYQTLGIASLPASFWTGANVPAGQQPGYIPVGMKLESFSDYSVFDWRNRIFDESSRQSDSFHTFNLTLSQTAWEDRMGVELAYDTQRIDRRGKNSFTDFTNTGPISIDINRSLPDGTLNPNYGRPFVGTGGFNWSDYFQESNAKRATAFLKYDFKDLDPSWGKWLGRHVLTGVYQEESSTVVSYARRLHSIGAASEAADPGNVFALARRPSWVVYLGPSIIGNDNPLQLNAIQIPEIKSGASIPVRYFVREPNQTDPGHFENSSNTFVDVVAYGQGSREVIKSQSAVLQSYWLDETLITMLSWRRDESYLAQKPIAFAANPNDRNDPGKAFYGLDDMGFARTPPLTVAREIKSYGAVLNLPKRFPRPRGTDFGIFVNESENFTPISGRQDQFAQPLAPPTGKTTEYGFNFSALHGKLQVRLNSFKTELQGVSSSPGFFSTLRGSILNIGLNWAQWGNTNPAMEAQSKADLELLFSRLPANYRQLYDFRVSGTAPNIAASANVVAIASTDTVDSTAKGLEMDVTYNVTKNWRILLNVAKQETVQSNMYPFTKYFVELMKPVWDQLSNRPAGGYPAGFQPGDTLPSNLQTYGQYLDQNIYVPMASALASEGVAAAEQRKWRANFVTNYSFDRNSIFGGKLNGWAIGGAVRWQDKLGIGYPGTRTPDGKAHFDIEHPYYAPSETNVDAWLSYTRKVWGNKVGWKVQLNATNILGTSDLIPVLAQSWSGKVAQYRTPPEKRIYLTNTFSF